MKVTEILTVVFSVIIILCLQMPHDLDLQGRAIPMGTLLLLPLVFKGRPLGCVYAFVRCNPKSVSSITGWTELAGEKLKKYQDLSSPIS